MTTETTQMQKLMFDKYGPTMRMTELADCLGIKSGTLKNNLSQATCPVKTYKQGKLRFANTIDVASYLDEQRQKAA